jgi:Sugar phosphate permease
MKRLTGKLFYGWIIVFAGFLLTGLSVGIQTNCNVAFLKPMSDTLGYTITQIALNTTLQSLAMIPCYIILPKVLKKLSYRKMALISGLGYIVLKCLFAMAQNLWQFYFISIMIGFCIPGISFMMVNSLIDGWFQEKKGLALGITATGAGVSGAVFLPITTNIIEKYGWRYGNLFQAVLIGIMLIASLLMIRDTPESVGLKPLGYKEEKVVNNKRGFTLKQAEKIPAFYLLLIGVFFLSVIGMGIQPYLMSSLEEAGYQAIFASKIVSIILIVATIGKILLGSAFDKLGTKYAGIFIGGLFILSFLIIIWVSSHSWLAFLFALVFGVTYTTLSIPVPYLIMELFGSKEFTQIYGVALMISSTGSTIGSILTGLIHDYSGSYKPAWFLYIILSSVVIISIQRARHIIKYDIPAGSNIMEEEYVP